MLFVKKGQNFEKGVIFRSFLAFFGSFGAAGKYISESQILYNPVPNLTSPQKSVIMYL